MLLRSFKSADEDQVISLWQACNLVVPQNDPRKDIARKLKVNPELFIVGELAGDIVGSCMAGYEGHRGWINYLAVHPHHQRQGYATQLMKEAERLLREVGCPKINLQIRSSNSEVIAFYNALGYVEDCVVSFGLRLQSDQIGEQDSAHQSTTAP